MNYKQEFFECLEAAEDLASKGESDIALKFIDYITGLLDPYGVIDNDMRAALLKTYAHLTHSLCVEFANYCTDISDEEE